jgi:hypothetical protein
MQKFIFLAGLMLVPTVALSSSNICKLEDNLLSAKAIAWDTSTGKAKVTDAFNETHTGQVRLERPHSSLGVKTNIFVKYDSPDYDDAAEYVIFPTGESEYRVIAVTYVFSDGGYHLSTLRGNHTASCMSM